MIHALIGHSASGKSRIERNLEGMGYPRIISYTTRPPRDGEVNGVDYHFIHNFDFYGMERKGYFSETAKYRDWNYGLSLNGIDYKGKDYIVVVTVHGYEELLKVVGKDNINAIHIKVEEAERLRRLLVRGDEIDEAIRRILADREDFANVEDISDHVVENKDIDKALVQVYNIINAK